MKTCEKCGKEYENFYIACPKCDLGRSKEDRKVDAPESRFIMTKTKTMAIKFLNVASMTLLFILLLVFFLNFYMEILDTSSKKFAYEISISVFFLLYSTRCLISGRFYIGPGYVERDDHPVIFYSCCSLFFVLGIFLFFARIHT